MYNATDLNESSKFRTNLSANWEGQACNDKHPLIDPDNICSGVGLETNEKTFNIGFHKNLDNITTSGWKEFPKNKIHVKTRQTDIEMKQSLGVEAIMV